MITIPRVLSIAGTDPTGGAGIQADLKSIAANGGYGMAVITALVAQNTQGVSSIHLPPTEFLDQQLTAVSDDVTIDAVKLGMLFNADVINTVRDWLERVKPPVVVLDPVMVATSGDRLLTEATEDSLRQLLTLADLITPNLVELAALTSQPLATSWQHALEQGRTVASDYGVQVLVKGGHLDGDQAPDALVTIDTTIEFTSERINTVNAHGTGCSLSSAIATLRPQTDNWEQAIRRAKSWLTTSLRAADDLQVGQGSGPISHFAELWREKSAIPAESIAAQWWEGIADIRSDIDALPFLTELANGTLPADAFNWYLTQDALYLIDYARALSVASILAPTTEEQIFWSASARNAIATERDLHTSWLRSDAIMKAQRGEATTHYVNHLLATAARGNYAELIAALLPCYWIYADVGSRLVTHAHADHPYASWLHTYGDAEFEHLTNQAIDIVTRCASAVNAITAQQMREAFEVSARHELHFFAATAPNTNSRGGQSPRPG